MLAPGGGVLEPELSLVHLLAVDVEVDGGRGVLHLHVQHHLLPFHGKDHSSDRPGQNKLSQ